MDTNSCPFLALCDCEEDDSPTKQSSLTTRLLRPFVARNDMLVEVRTEPRDQFLFRQEARYPFLDFAVLHK